MGLKPREFWRTTLAEWRAMVAGLDERRRRENRETAWLARYVLIAGGASPDKLTVEALLGEEEEEPPVEMAFEVGSAPQNTDGRTLDEIAREMIARQKEQASATVE